MTETSWTHPTYGRHALRHDWRTILPEIEDFGSVHPKELFDAYAFFDAEIKKRIEVHCYRRGYVPGLYWDDQLQQWGWAWMNCPDQTMSRRPAMEKRYDEKRPISGRQSVRQGIPAYGGLDKDGCERPRTVYVYFIRAGRKFVKIGHALRPDARLASLQVGCPVKLRLILALPGDVGNEPELHAAFAADRAQGEWFRLSKSLRRYIRAARMAGRILSVKEASHD